MDDKELLEIVKCRVEKISCEYCREKNSAQLLKLFWEDYNLKGIIDCLSCNERQKVKFHLYQVLETKKAAEQ